jgi:hypothetical protein
VPGVIPFIDDDDGYLAWIASEPGGYVLNSHRHPTASYLMLHRSSCRTISGRPTTGSAWTKDYVKHCSSSADELDAWASATVGVNADRCAVCTP